MWSPVANNNFQNLHDMKKILLLAVLLLPAAPSLVVGINSQSDTTEARRAAMMEERFKAFCSATGFDYYGSTEAELNNYYDDFFMETDDYQAAADSVDSVLSVINRVLTETDR